MQTQGSFLVSASFGMVTLSVSALAAYGLIDEVDRGAKKSERERAELRAALRAVELDADLLVSRAQRRADEAVTEARLQAHEASAAAREAETELVRLRDLLGRSERARRLAEQRADEAEGIALRSEARSRAALELAEAAESYAMEIDARLGRVERERDLLRHESANLRDLASRRLPDIAPSQARDELDALRAALSEAKRSPSGERPYRVGLACSGLRTFEANASGYTCSLGRSLLAEARTLRADPACLAFDHRVESDGSSSALSALEP